MRVLWFKSTLVINGIGKLALIHGTFKTEQYVIISKETLDEAFQIL